MANLNDERGFVLVITMLILVVMTILCIGGLESSTFEVQIAANDRQSRVAFNLADGGAMASGKLLSQTIEANAAPDYIANGLSYVNLPDPINGGTIPDTTADAYLDRVQGFSALRVDGLYDFMLDTNAGQAYGRINSREAKGMAGGSAEFATGSAGTGAGSTGGVALEYDIDVDSYAARNSNTRLAVRFRKVLGVAGGM